MSTITLHRTASRPHRSGLDRPAVIGAGLALTSAAFAVALLTISGTGDYAVQLPVSGDNAGPALSALAHGHVGAFFAHQPLMGLVSLLLRAPVVAVAGHLGGGSGLAYRAGCAICLLPAAGLAAWLIAREDSGRRRAAGALAGVLVVCGPQTRAALGAGHPEEILAVTLAVLALLLAERDRPVPAGLLAGAAAATKPWAAIGLVPLAFALSSGHLRALACAVVVAAVLAGLPAVLDPAAFSRASASLGDSRLVTALSAWWPLHALGGPAGPGGPAGLAGELPLGLTKSTALAGALGAVTVAVGLAAAWVRGYGRRIEPLALLALLGLVRCLADPAPVDYYFVAAVVPLAVWEVTRRRRFPLLAVALAALVRLLFTEASRLTAVPTSALVLLGGAVVLLLLAASAFLVARPGPRPETPGGGS